MENQDQKRIALIELAREHAMAESAVKESLGDSSEMMRQYALDLTLAADKATLLTSELRNLNEEIRQEAQFANEQVIVGSFTGTRSEAESAFSGSNLNFTNAARAEMAARNETININIEGDALDPEKIADAVQKAKRNENFRTGGLTPSYTQ